MALLLALLLALAGCASPSGAAPAAPPKAFLPAEEGAAGALEWPKPLPPPLGLAYNGSALTLPGGATTSRYINRELSWLAFNERVLAEAESPRHPLLERVRFLSISFNNLDEFHTVRIAALIHLEKENVQLLSADGLTPPAQLAQVTAAARTILADQQRVWRLLQEELRAADVARVVSVANLDATDRAFLHRTFMEELWPQLTPQSIDSAHPFPFISNREMGLLLTLVRRNGEGGGGAAAPAHAQPPPPPSKRSSKRKGENNGNSGGGDSPAATVAKAETRGQDHLSHAVSLLQRESAPPSPTCGP